MELKLILKHNAQIRQGQILLVCHVDNRVLICYPLFVSRFSISNFYIGVSRCLWLQRNPCL